MLIINNDMIIVLRLNHRIARDHRITTHVALVARAFGANELYYSGDKDSNLEEGIKKINERFGGNFIINHIQDPIEFIKNKKKQNYKIAHLTMYGLELEKEISKIRKYKNILIIIGGEKVEPIYYELSDFNISITNQPHSEVSALALFLDRYYAGNEFKLKFDNAKIKIIPSNKKKVIKLK